ncbi:hypothetical protein Q9L58_004050 [Maublancomyces gigas]|uniref:PPPDE domain-containing protein n=1 Tax=Discina gigas TaxID=1032678 RepID=A0ABR3GM07_9PEZI
MPDSPVSAASHNKPPRKNREFRLMYRETATTASPEKEHKPKKKWSLTKRNVGVQFVDDLSARLGEKFGHWALAVLEPTDPPVITPGEQKPRPTRPAMAYDDPRIQRVYEVRRKGISETPGDDQHPEHIPRPSTPGDSNDEDRHDEDDGFPDINKAGEGLKMQISTKLRNGFSELKYEHFGGLCWEILTGIEARTKFSNSELRHEAERIWKRQLNYHVMDNNCQQFCVLLAISIRAKNHSLLRVLHGKTVARQMKQVKDLRHGDKAK